MVLHQLSEGGPLRRHGVPALPHDHVPAKATAARGQPGALTANSHTWAAAAAAAKAAACRSGQEGWRHVQLMCAVGGFVHSVSLLQQLEELLHRDPRVRRPPQREDLPHQDPVGPPGHTERSRCEVQVWRRGRTRKQSCSGGNVDGCVRLRIDGAGESVDGRKGRQRK